MKAKRSADDDAQRLRRYAAPVANVPIAAFTLDHAEQVMRESPKGSPRRRVGRSRKR